MDNAARTRQRVLALFLPIAAVLYISAEALSPKGTDQVATDTATALKLLAIAAKHPTQVYIAGTCAVLGLGALAVSYAAIAALASHTWSRPAYPCSSIQRPPGRARTDALNRGGSVTRVLFRLRSGPVRFASSSRLDPPPGTEARQIPKVMNG